MKILFFLVLRKRNTVPTIECFLFNVILQKYFQKMLFWNIKLITRLNLLIVLLYKTFDSRSLCCFNKDWSFKRNKISSVLLFYWKSMFQKKKISFVLLFYQKSMFQKEEKISFVQHFLDLKEKNMLSFVLYILEIGSEHQMKFYISLRKSYVRTPFFKKLSEH